MKRTTRKAVNAALEAAGFENTQLVMGDGYWYFTEIDSDGPTGPSAWYTSSVPVMWLRQLTVDEWVAEAHALAAARME